MDEAENIKSNLAGGDTERVAGAKDDGGPAFPVTPTDRSGQCAPTECGLSLRDYFAAKAMQELLASSLRVAEAGDGETSMNTLNLAAASAYQMADEMIEARKA